MPKCHETVIDDYRIVVRGDVARVWDTRHSQYLGRVWIDHTNAWNVEFEGRVGYIPIKPALRCLGYPDRGSKKLRVLI
jgi:hypothetical protein